MDIASSSHGKHWTSSCSAEDSLYTGQLRPHDPVVRRYLSHFYGWMGEAVSTRIWPRAEYLTPVNNM
jgi:hypothetical protein